MTTEDDFRDAITANPDDWQTLLVFSDWLRERDDSRADGYAALARLHRHPVPDKLVGWLWGRTDNTDYKPPSEYAPGLLPPDWYALTADTSGITKHAEWWCSAKLLDLFDAAAHAFAQLSAARRAQILATAADAQ